jgi:hypothetical protein
MKLGRHNYAFIKPCKNSCIKFINKNFSCLQRYDAQNYKVLRTKCFSVCPNIASNSSTIATFKISSKRKIMIQIKLVGISMFAHSTNLNLSKYNDLWIVSIKRNVKFNFKPHAMFLSLAIVVLLQVVYPCTVTYGATVLEEPSPPSRQISVRLFPELFLSGH